MCSLISNDVYYDNLKRLLKFNNNKFKKVFVMGLCNLGAEIAYNLICNGVNTLYLSDDKPISNDDINSSIFYNLESIGKSKSTELTKVFNNLYPNVKVINFKGDIDKDLINDSILILVNSSFDNTCILNDFIRSNNCKTIFVKQSGVCGFIFIDANNYSFYENGNENIKPVQLHSINNDGLVRCAQHSYHNFKSGDEIYFTNLEGNNLEFLRTNWTINVISKDCFQLIDFSLENEFEFINGTCYLNLKKNTINHNSLVNELDNPSFNDEENSYRILELFKLLEDNEISSPWSLDNDKFLDGYDLIGKKLIRSFNVNNPSAISIFSSRVSMEVFKFLSGFYKPINQWFFWNDISIIPEEKPNNIDNCDILFGDKYSKILNTNILILGSSRLCIEWLKILHYYKVAYNGKIYIIDNSIVKKRNIYNNLIFNKNDIDKYKVNVLCRKFSNYNSYTKYIPFNIDVSSINEKIFSDVDLVINTINNLTVSNMISNTCFDKNLPLFLSNLNKFDIKLYSIIPFVTDTYNSMSDLIKEIKYPLCQKESPNQIDHTIHYAANEFKFFRRFCSNINSFKNDKNFYNDLPVYDQGKVKKDVQTFIINRDLKDFNDCLIFAIDIFIKEFRYNIIKLLKTLPEDHKNSSNEKYWSGGKRCPKPLKLDKENVHIVDFIEATGHLLAKCCCLDDNFTKEDIFKVISNYEIKEYEFFSQNDDDIILPDNLTIDKKFKYPSFDIGEDWRLKYISSYANCRALNYNIPTLGLFESKEIIDRINFLDMDEIEEINFNNIKTLDTITNAIGLLSYELIKYLLCDNIKENIYNTIFVNCRNGNIEYKKCIDAPKTKINENWFLNKWDKLIYNNDSTLGELIDEYNKKLNLNEEIYNVSMICYGSDSLYIDSFVTKYNDKKLYDIFLEKGIDIKKNSVNIEILIDDENSDDLDDDGIELNVKIFLNK